MLRKKQENIIINGGVQFTQKKRKKEKKIVGSFGAMHYYLRCGTVRLCYFAGSFDVVFAVYTVWWTPLLLLMQQLDEGPTPVCWLRDESIQNGGHSYQLLDLFGIPRRL